MKDPQNLCYVPNFMKDDKLSKECKNLISSLPKDQDFDGNNICNYQGCWYYYNTLQAVLNFQNHFRARDTDIILASYPKSGTTWLKALIFALVQRRRYLSNPENHPLLSQNPHSLVPFVEIDLYCKSETPDLTKLSSPRIFATHVPFCTLHEALEASPCKVVYVCRNIKDTLVSYWHFKSRYQYKELSTTTLQAMFESYCEGTHFYGPFWDNVLGYWEESLENPKRVLFMKYEEIIEEPRVQLKRLADFLGCPFTEEEEEESGLVDEILELCSLRNLSNLEANKAGRASCDVDRTAYFRKGEVGDWRNYLTLGMAKKLDEIVEEKLHGSGLKF